MRKREAGLHRYEVSIGPRALRPLWARGERAWADAGPTRVVQIEQLPALLSQIRGSRFLPRGARSGSPTAQLRCPQVLPPAPASTLRGTRRELPADRLLEPFVLREKPVPLTRVKTAAGPAPPTTRFARRGALGASDRIAGMPLAGPGPSSSSRGRLTCPSSCTPGALMSGVTPGRPHVCTLESSWEQHLVLPNA
jgi:hypothetical protein